MTDYYEGILKMQGARGLVVAAPLTHTIVRSAAVEVGSEPVLSQGSTAGEAEEAEEDGAPAEQGPAGADAAVAAEPALSAAELAACHSCCPSRRPSLRLLPRSAAATPTHPPLSGSKWFLF